MPNLAIADDFSGAAEIAGIALRFGIQSTILRTNPVTSASSRCEPPLTTLTILDTDSRSLPPQQAAEKVRQALHSLPNHTLLFKKIDSVLRGPILAEIDAALAATNRTTAIVLPANPSRHRIIRDGHYYIANIPLHQTAFAQDPQYPALTSNVLDRVGAAPHVYTANPSTPLRPGIALANAQSPAEVHAWAARITPNTLPVGGADFFTALLRERQSPDWPRQQDDAPTPTRSGAVLLPPTLAASRSVPPGTRTYLLVSGTTSTTAHQALDRAQSAGTPIHNLPHSLYAQTTAAPTDARTWQQALLHDLQTQGRAIAAIRHPIDPARSEHLLDVLTHTIAQVLADLPTPCEIFVEGGATAAHLANHLNWHHFTTHQELAPGIVRLAIPQAPTRWLTAKPGSYPWPDEVWSLLGSPRL